MPNIDNELNKFSKLSLLERMNLKNDGTVNFKVKKHKLIKNWEKLAESGIKMRII